MLMREESSEGDKISLFMFFFSLSFCDVGYKIDRELTILVCL